MRSFLLLLIATAILTACSSSVADDTVQIDYAALDELERSKVMEITESEDYMPGIISSLRVDANENIIIWDRAKVTLEQFDPAGNYMATVAVEGEGPEEISRSTHLAGMFGDTLLIIDQSAGRYSMLVPGPDGIYRPQQDFSLIDAQRGTPTILDALTPERLFLNVHQPGNYDDYGPNDPANREGWVQLVNLQHEVVVDSLHRLSFPKHIVEVSADRRSMYPRPPIYYEDQIRVSKDGNYMVFRSDSSKIQLFDSGHILQREIPLNVVERPVLQSDLDLVLGGYPPNLQEKMKPRVPEFKPPFLDVWVSDQYIWLHTDNTPDGKELVVLSRAGEPLGRLMLGETEVIQQMVNKDIYVIDNASEGGPAVKVYRVVI